MEDTHATHNYMVSMKQIIAKARITIDDNLDLEELNEMTAKDDTPKSPRAGAYPVQTYNPERGQSGSRKFNKPKQNVRPQGEKRKYQPDSEPSNMDARGNLLYDMSGNPQDLTKETPKRMQFDPSAPHTSGFQSYGSKKIHSPRFTHNNKRQQTSNPVQKPNSGQTTD